jgi:helicase MOV-10
MWREWLNFVHEKGGWRGREINWNPEDPLVAGGYDEGIRTQAEADAREMIQRIRAQYLHNFEPFDEEDDDDDDGQDVREYPGRDVD